MLAGGGERLTNTSYDVDDYSGIVDLIEVIQPQESGPTEAARALRKKLYVESTSVAAFGTVTKPFS